jgi:hypothetical protein
MVWSISDIQAAHFHIAPRGVNSGVTKEVTFDANRAAVGSWTSSDATDPLTTNVVNNLFQGRLYFNVHTLQNAGGEIRGQLFQPETYVAFASGANEVPPVTLAGNAAAFFLYNPTDTTIFMAGHAANMSSKITGAHVHEAVTGSIVKPTPISVSADGLAGTLRQYWTPTDTTNKLSPLFLDAVKAGQLYWNVHTELHPAGEVRGTIGKTWTNSADSGMWFMAMLSGAQEGSTSEPSSALGTAFGLLSPDGKTFKMQVMFNDLTGPVLDGHIHFGAAGTIPENNVVIHFPSNGSLLWTANDADRPLTASDIDSLFAGHYYVNIHSAKFPAGEIRGQLIPLSQPAPTLSVTAVSGTGSGLLLDPNYPNPFNPTTTLHYTLPNRGSVKLEAKNALGNTVATIVDATQDAGPHEVQFDASGLPSGVYYISLSSGGETRRITATLNK